MTRITFDALMGVSWAFTGVALILTAVRYWVRSTITRRLDWDDAVHLLGALLMVAQVSVVTGGAPTMYKLGNKDESSSSSSTAAEVALLLRLDLAATLIAWSCLWSIKLSFLLLYRRIFKISVWFTRAWWVVAAFVGLTFWALVAGTMTQCGGIDRIEDAEYCSSPPMLQRQKIFVIYSCILNILTDIAIMALPLAMLPPLQIPRGAKLSLIAIFTLASFIIVFDILRTTQTLRSSHRVGEVALWTDLEAAVAVAVGCLPSFVALLRERRGSGGGGRVVGIRRRYHRERDGAEGEAKRRAGWWGYHREKGGEGEAERRFVGPGAEGEAKGGEGARSPSEGVSLEEEGEGGLGGIVVVRESDMWFTAI